MDKVRSHAPSGLSPALFISYRRADTQSFARDLHKHLAAAFGHFRVFMDRAEIRFGEDWEVRLQEELRRSTVVLALVGPQWISLRDDAHRRRIDDPEDWVHRELALALRDGKEIVPIYVGGAEPIRDPSVLPEALQQFARKQAIVLTEESWNDGMERLVRRLDEFGLNAAEPRYPMPSRLKVVAPLSNDEINLALAALKHWRVMGDDRRVPGSTGSVPHTELYREFTFERFEDATAFMADASASINQLQHHPRWENFWTTVRVWLSTWDIEFKLSQYDVELATWLDGAYTEFKSNFRNTKVSLPPGGGPSRGTVLEAAEVHRELKRYACWVVDQSSIRCRLRFPDFQTAFGFMTAIALAAESKNHHPAWSNDHEFVDIVLTTRYAGGVTNRDIDLAVRIAQLARQHGGAPTG